MKKRLLTMISLVTSIVILSGCAAYTAPQGGGSASAAAPAPSSAAPSSAAASSVAASAPAANTVGLMLNTSGAYPGYTLVAPKHYTSTYLINNEGQTVHIWTGSRYEPGQSCYLLENGNLMRAAMTKG